MEELLKVLIKRLLGFIDQISMILVGMALANWFNPNPDSTVSTNVLAIAGLGLWASAALVKSLLEILFKEDF